MKLFTANELNKQPAPAFRAADKGLEVVITHSHYPDRVFKLVAEDKEDEREGIEAKTS